MSTSVVCQLHVITVLRETIWKISLHRVVREERVVFGSFFPVGVFGNTVRNSILPTPPEDMAYWADCTYMPGYRLQVFIRLCSYSFRAGASKTVK